MISGFTKLLYPDGGVYKGGDGRNTHGSLSKMRRRVKEQLKKKSAAWSSTMVNFSYFDNDIL
jgi:predicted ATP-dependent Lon-type protease